MYIWHRFFHTNTQLDLFLHYVQILLPHILLCKFYELNLEIRYFGSTSIRNRNRIISNNTNMYNYYRKHIDDDIHLHNAINSCNFLTDFYNFVSNSIHLTNFDETVIAIFDEIISLLLFL